MQEKDDKKVTLDNTICEISKVLEKHKNEEKNIDPYRRIMKLREKRGLL